MISEENEKCQFIKNIKRSKAKKKKKNELKKQDVL